MKNILAIYGSHRRGQNSDTLLDILLKGMEAEATSVKKLYVAALKIKPCLACDHCYKDAKCIIKDDMQSIYEDFERADIVITATPIYFNTVSSGLKTLIDRCQSIWSGKYILGKSPISRKKRLGHVICTAGSTMADEDFDCTIKVLDMFYKCINAELTGKTLVADTDKLHVKDNKDLLDAMLDKGRDILEGF